MVIMATGVRPRISLASEAGCKIGRWAVEVNDKMQTSIPNIYAVGDCVEVHVEEVKCYAKGDKYCCFVIDKDEG